jgi:hypothetical protein
MNTNTGSEGSPKHEGQPWQAGPSESKQQSILSRTNYSLGYCDPRVGSTVNATYVEFDFCEAIDAEHRRKLEGRDARLEAWLFRNYGIFTRDLRAHHAPNYGCKGSEAAKMSAHFKRWLNKRLKEMRAARQLLPLWAWVTQASRRGQHERSGGEGN